MRACRSIEFITHILPARAWKGNILEHHISRCASCRARLAIQDEARPYVVEPGAGPASDSIWAAVEAGIQEGYRGQRRRFLPEGRVWKIAACLAAAAPLVYLAILVSKPTRSIGPRPDAPMIEDFRLDSAEAWGKPVSAMIYQARDSHISIIWVK
jgi:hypothetical protein